MDIALVSCLRGLTVGLGLEVVEVGVPPGAHARSSQGRDSIFLVAQRVLEELCPTSLLNEE